MTDIEELEFELWLYEGCKETYELFKRRSGDNSVAAKILLKDLRKREKYIKELQEKIKASH